MKNRSERPARKAGERGYALVALLALMTIMAFAMAAAAPSVRQQNQRLLEREAVRRGEEVAEAIRLYFRAKRVLPTSIDQLLEGVEPFPGALKKVQILRPSAARDPLSSTGEWRLIKTNDKEFIEFQRAVMLYAGGRLPMTRDQALRQIPVANMGGVVKLDSGGKEEREEKGDAPGGEITSTTSGVPFVGVASRSRRESVLTYYDLERHDEWVFTPLFK